MSASVALKAKTPLFPGTVGRGKAVTLDSRPTHTHWTDGQISLHLGNSLDHYAQWDTPTVIVSDGAYGILGFEGDTSDHLGIADCDVQTPLIACKLKAQSTAPE
jgi:site-specific DNA-methyltransferase (adenine-specific)